MSTTTQSINDEAVRDLAGNRTAGTLAVFLRLLGKEAKQLTPLLAVLVGCGVFLHLVGQTQPTGHPEGYHATILALIPVLFAVGVGPMLISQEKEHRTLRWMASLPVPPWLIVASKLMVSLLGLIVIWCISLLITFVICPSVLSATYYTNIELMAWPVNTFFMLLMGFALAWILPTAGSSLVVQLASASAAWIFAIVANDTFSARPSVYNSAEYFGFAFFSHLVVTAILVGVALRFGKRSFVTEAKRETSSSRALGQKSEKLAVDRTKAPRQSPASSLIWQVGWQNRMLWVSAIFVVLMGLASVAYELKILQSRAIIHLTPFVGSLVLCWLGASVFGSDAHHGRIRFLTERGVAPFKIWWTRLALPLSCVLIGTFVILLLINSFESAQKGRRVGFLPNEMLVGLLAVLMTFGFAQWLPQWTRSTLIAFCISPVLAIFSFMYIGFLLGFINPPWWLLVLSISIPFAATRIMLCPWMDGRTGLKYWLLQTALLTGTLVLPLIPLLFTLATYSNMPGALRQELAVEAKKYEPLTQGDELVIPSQPKREATGKTDDNFVGFGNSVSTSLVALERKLQSISGPIIFSYPVMRTVTREAELMSLRMDNQSDEPADGQQRYRERYRRSLILLSNLAIHMRMGVQLMDQEAADQIERWIVRELLKPNRRELFSEEEFSGIVAALADRSGRYKSRRRAIVVAWYGYNGWYTYGEDRYDFGHLYAPTIPMDSMAASRLVADRNVGQATAALLKYLDSKPAASDEFPAEIRFFWTSRSPED